MSVVVEHISKSYGNVTAVKDLSFEVPKGQFLTLLGPSGCGKTTTLRCIGGHERIDHGRIYIGDTLIASAEKNVHVHPSKRNCGFVFQMYALWPHMTVFKNIEFPLVVRKIPVPERRDLVKNIIGELGLNGLESRYVSQLSGGQQQRVSLARALVFEPKALLMDEPLSNLDLKLRMQAREMLKELQRSRKIPTIYVTHDQTEAFALSDKIYLMKDGQVAQEGTALELYQQPASEFVTNFVGTANTLRVAINEVSPSSQGLQFFTYQISAEDSQQLTCKSKNGEFRKGEKCLFAIRPEHLVFCATKPGANAIRATIQRRMFLGAEVSYKVGTSSGSILNVVTTSRILLPEGKEIWVSFNPERGMLLKD